MHSLTCTVGICHCSVWHTHLSVSAVLFMSHMCLYSSIWWGIKCFRKKKRIAVHIVSAGLEQNSQGGGDSMLQVLVYVSPVIGIILVVIIFVMLYKICKQHSKNKNGNQLRNVDEQDGLTGLGRLVCARPSFVMYSSDQPPPAPRRSSSIHAMSCYREVAAAGSRYGRSAEVRRMGMDFCPGGVQGRGIWLQCTLLITIFNVMEAISCKYWLSVLQAHTLPPLGGSSYPLKFRGNSVLQPFGGRNGIQGHTFDKQFTVFPGNQGPIYACKVCTLWYRTCCCWLRAAL